MSLRILDLHVPGHVPLSDRGDHLDLWVEGAHRDVDPHLVVALSGAAMGDGVCALALRHLDQLRGYQRPAERGGERVLPLVHPVGLYRWMDVPCHELLPSIHLEVLD